MSEMSNFCDICPQPLWKETFASFPELGLHCGMTQGLAHTVRRSGENEGFVASWIIAGEGRFLSPEGDYPLDGGCVCLRRPGHAYDIEFYREAEHRRCYLRVSDLAYQMLCQLYPRLDTMPPVRPFPYDPALYAQFQALIDQMFKTSRERLFRLFPDMISLLLQMTGIKEDAEEAPLERARRLLSQVRAPRSLDDIASACGMSYRLFRKQFTQAYGTSPGQYRIACRIREAERALTTGYTVQEVADMLCYTDIYSFSHQFSKSTGMSPSAYRRQTRDGAGE